MRVIAYVTRISFLALLSFFGRGSGEQAGGALLFFFSDFKMISYMFLLCLCAAVQGQSGQTQIFFPVDNPTCFGSRLDKVRN